uniref:STAS domain-containing protein n=1 Tax=Panagrolaimus sp. JU765 TaxID=591449 RepID=A0AC34RSK4_9BILA
MEDYSILPINPISITMTLTFTVGICEIAAAVLRLGFLTSYFSDPLIAGFTTGAAVHVLVSQLDDVLGVKLTRVSGPGYLFVIVYRLILKIPECNLWTLGASASGGLFLILGKDYISPLIHRCTGKKIVVPYELLVMIIATAISHFLKLNIAHDVPVVGTVPAGLPEPTLPNFSLIPECFSTAAAIAVISIALDISLSKMIAKKLDYKIDPGQEIYALGFVSTLSSFFPVFPISTALGRTMVQVESGVRTQFAALFSSLFLLAVILFLGPYFETLPLCILSTVILVAIRPMFKKFSDLPRLWKVSKYDFATWIVSFAATVCIDVIGGLATALIFTIMTVVIRTQLPYWESKISCPPISTTQKTLNNWTWKMPNLMSNMAQNEKINYFIFDFSSITQIDSMGLRAIQDVIDDVEQQTNSTIYFAFVQHHIKDLLIETKIVENQDKIWDSVDEILKFIKYDTTENHHVNHIVIPF